MNERLVRTYQNKDITELSKHLFVYGDISGSCENCKAIDLKLEMSECPECHTQFKFISFRNVKNHLPKMKKISKERPGVEIIDYDDFKKCLGVIKAENFLK